MLLNDVIALTLTLINWNSDTLVELVLLTHNHLIDGGSHLLDQEDVQFGVEPILVILMETLDRALLSKVLLYDSNDRLLHTFLQDVVLSRLIDFV